MADTANHRIQEFSVASGSGAFVRSGGGLATGGGAFDTPAGVAASDAGDLYVADTGNNRVQQFKCR